MGKFNYSGENTLLYLFQMIKNTFVKKEDGKKLSSNDFTDAEKQKLNGLENYTLPTGSSTVKGGFKVGAGLSVEGDTLSASGGGVADSVNWSGVIGRPEASTDVATDKDDQTKYTTPYAVHQYVGSKLGAALQFKGSIAFASLPALTAEVAGYVYNVTDDFTTTENFLEGAGHTYAAGQNVAIATVSDGVYRYDVLSQPIDLSAYAKTEDFTEIENSEFDSLWNSVFTGD